MKELSSGAEAIIYLDEDSVLKDRIAKAYRIKEIDDVLRKSRTKRESSVLVKLNKLGLAVPKVNKITGTVIDMEFIDGIQLKKILDKRPGLAELAGKNLTLMHDAQIMHGDLTTSNMILKDDKLYFIDFGLSFQSDKIEDKAVDIHLFKQALDSKHFRVSNDAYESFLKGYTPKHKKEILERLRTVEQRGRYKEKT